MDVRTSRYTVSNVHGVWLIVRVQQCTLEEMMPVCSGSYKNAAKLSSNGLRVLTVGEMLMTAVGVDVSGKCEMSRLVCEYV